MGEKFTLEDKEYDLDELSDSAKNTVELLKFATDHINEICGNFRLLVRAKNSYVEGLKKEVVSNKAGLLFEDN